jgi:hypothetical protein
MMMTRLFGYFVYGAPSARALEPQLRRDRVYALLQGAAPHPSPGDVVVIYDVADAGHDEADLAADGLLVPGTELFTLVNVLRLTGKTIDFVVTEEDFRGA